MVDWYKIIKELTDKGEPLFLDEIRQKLGNPDRARLLGYLKCLVDLNIIQSKKQGNAIVYYKNKGDKK